MKIKVNQEACIGCGACVAVCEDLFEIGDDGLSQAKVNEVPENQVEQAKEAVETCPTGAIVSE